MKHNDSSLWRLNNPEKQLVITAKSIAKRFNIAFDISHKDISIPEECPYLKIPLEYVVGDGYRENAPSIDRIDNSKGYVKGNVEVISRKANTMKSNASTEELLEFAYTILERN